ncbi:DUF3099 domain-containing protein [Mariniluteicoccus flavus]
MPASARRPGGQPEPLVITTARRGRSVDLSRREVRYAVTMSIRIACFIAMAFVGGPWRWVLLGAAAVLPGIAVLFANAVDRRGERTPVIDEGPSYHRALEREASPTAGVIIDQD